jgi:hypothetical protein
VSGKDAVVIERSNIVSDRVALFNVKWTLSSD